MKWRITGVLVNILLLWASSASAQQQLIYSQYMFNGFAFNPAFAGSHEALSITAAHRSQGAGAEGLPSFQSLSGHMPVEGKRVALGASLFRESFDIVEQIGLQMAYAYRLPLRDGVLSLGVQGGFINTTKDFTDLPLWDPEDPEFADGTLAAFMPTFGAGVYYSAETFYFAFSIPQLGAFNRGQGNQEVVDIAEIRQYIFTTGYTANLNNDVKFSPSLLVRVTEGLGVEIDVNANMIVSETFWVGLSYRHNTSLNFITQLQVTDQLRFGYAYDLETTNLRRVSSGNHEIMLNYRFQLFSGSERKVAPELF